MTARLFFLQTTPGVGFSVSSITPTASQLNVQGLGIQICPEPCFAAQVLGICTMQPQNAGTKISSTCVLGTQL